MNIDAVIAASLLKLLWPRYRNGQFSENLMEMAAFTAFLFSRMAGCAGEIDDHINRGRNMERGHRLRSAITFRKKSGFSPTCRVETRPTKTRIWLQEFASTTLEQLIG